MKEVAKGIQKAFFFEGKESERIARRWLLNGYGRNGNNPISFAPGAAGGRIGTSQGGVPCSGGCIDCCCCKACFGDDDKNMAFILIDCLTNEVNYYPDEPPPPAFCYILLTVEYEGPDVQFWGHSNPNPGPNDPVKACECCSKIPQGGPGDCYIICNGETKYVVIRSPLVTRRVSCVDYACNNRCGACIALANNIEAWIENQNKIPFICQPNLCCVTVC